MMKGTTVSVFEYTVIMKEREDHVETGIVRATDKRDAEEKLKQLELYKPKLKQIKGISAFLKQFTADVK